MWRGRARCTLKVSVELYAIPDVMLHVLPLPVGRAECCGTDQLPLKKSVTGQLSPDVQVKRLIMSLTCEDTIQFGSTYLASKGTSFHSECLQPDFCGDMQCSILQRGEALKYSLINDSLKLLPIWRRRPKPRPDKVCQPLLVLDTTVFASAMPFVKVMPS